MNHNDKLIDTQIKDCPPAQTVSRIQEILADFGIQVELRWHESGVPYCYSNTLSVPGTTFRVNGKGLTRDFAIASAYGELIERLQVGFIYGPTSLKDGDFAIDDSRYELRPAKELLEANRQWYQRMAEVFQNSVGKTISAEQILTQCSTADGMVSVTPYFDLCSMEKVYFPTVLRKRIYGSNGCAAGNTPEEALVQAISEVVERHHQILTIKENLTLPEIPLNALEKYIVSTKIIQFVQDNGYKVIIKDASLGTGFPVICVCLIDRRTGRYHTHFGAHPIFEIALERALTESFQGRNIASITKNEDFTGKNGAKFSFNEFYTELRRSSGNKRPGFFVGECTLTFDPNMGVDACDNRQILRYCVDYFAQRGYPLLVRDCSCLGFPTYQVLVPGYSECYINRISGDTDDQRYAPYAITTLRNPSGASLTEKMGLLMHLNRMKQLQSGYHDMHCFTMQIKAPSNAPFPLQDFLMSASVGSVFYSIGKYSDAAASAGQMLSKAGEKDLGYLLCLKRYLTLLSEGYAPDYCRKVIDYFHTADIAQKLFYKLDRKENPFDDFTLRCDGNCRDTCPLKDHCFLKNVDTLAGRLDEKMQLLDMNATAAYLRSIL